MAKAELVGGKGANPLNPLGIDFVGPTIQSCKIGLDMVHAQTALQLQALQFLGQYFSSAADFWTKAGLMGQGPAGELTKTLTSSLDEPRKHLKTINELTREIPTPEWHSKNEIMFENEILTLRKFRKDGVEEVPGRINLIVPPQAGHHSSIVDYGPSQSLVDVSLAKQAATYAIEWKSATAETQHKSVDDYVLGMDECVGKMAPKGEKIVLGGFCQGAWLSTIYAALHPDKLKHLIVSVGPIDTKAASLESKIAQYAEIFPMEFYKGLVTMAGGNHNGIFQNIGFKSMDPQKKVIKEYRDIHDSADNEAKMQRTRRFRNWNEYTQVISGDFYLWIIDNIFKRNSLAKGELEVLGKKVNLGDINCDVSLVAGSEDDITHWKEVFAAREHLKGAASIRKLIVPAGHIGSFMANDIVASYWPDYFDYAMGISEKSDSKKALDSLVGGKGKKSGLFGQWVVNQQEAARNAGAELPWKIRIMPSEDPNDPIIVLDPNTEISRKYGNMEEPITVFETAQA